MLPTLRRVCSCPCMILDLIELKRTLTRGQCAHRADVCVSSCDSAVRRLQAKLVAIRQQRRQMQIDRVVGIEEHDPEPARPLHSEYPRSTQRCTRCGSTPVCSVGPQARLRLRPPTAAADCVSVSHEHRHVETYHKTALSGGEWDREGAGEGWRRRRAANLYATWQVACCTGTCLWLVPIHGGPTWTR